MSWKPKNKYGAIRVETDGYSFASKLELATYHLLKLRRRAGEIKEIKVQDHVKLSRANITYIADFRCERPDGTFFWVESKGYPSASWAIKLKLWKYYGPGDLEIWKGTFVSPVLTETVKRVFDPIGDKEGEE